MITIKISEAAATYGDMVDLLRHIADLIETDGCTSGVYPHWKISGEQEPQNT